ncbi:hypothetical protein GALMADRAFT_148636 [Galerina marginata CBS 339.88]|uniref:Uncharacterized protein n=1 Tax=Galerina marginata (strain CBS 339.88) TaxID=685588 RepID=A0A067SCS3_GALM3|nr:hypothetical protein GALMADRAFT_148636 [Galerina marginata CBS 339.88]
MPTSRVRILPSNNARYASVRAILYAATAANPISLPIQTRLADNRRSPLVEEAFSGMKVQSRIHDFLVSIRRGRFVHRFHIFLKNHKHLTVNAAVLALIPGCQWHGDILIMRSGSTTNGVVNLRARDGPLVRCLLRRFLRVAHQGRRLTVPKNLEF